MLTTGILIDNIFDISQIKKHMKEKLLKLGLNKTEIDIYLYLLSQKRATAADISKNTNIKRPTVYAAISELIRRKIVSEDLGGNSKYFIASAADLQNVIIAKKKDVLEEESLVNSLLPDLKKLAQDENVLTPKIQYVQESNLKDFFLKQESIWNESMLEIGETSWWGYNSSDATLHKSTQDWIEHYWKTAPKQIDVHLFSPEHPGEKELRQKKYARRHIKYWEEEFGSSLWIMGDFIVISVTNKNPQYLIQIKDKVMAEGLRRTYRRLWNLSK